MRRLLFALAVLLAGSAAAQTDDASPTSLAKRPWFIVSTAHFNVFSCGDTTDTYRLIGRLEQFQRAYALLAGKNATASPPIVVLAFPDHTSMMPFLPLYQGRPGNIAGFFTRGSDENLIVLSLPNADSPDMDVIFHEYAHLLFRHSDEIWPLWLKEGMAEVYSTFMTAGNHVEIARPIDRHLQTLSAESLMPLHELFDVSHDSPQYNEASRQGMFYAESWVLTDYLMTGDNQILRSRFPHYTELLSEGQTAEQAFTNALGVSLSAMESELNRYVKAGNYHPIDLKVTQDLSAPLKVNTRAVTPVEILFRFGDEMLRIRRPDDAQSWFEQAKQLAPASPLPYEGLGLLAAQRDDTSGAIDQLQHALQLGSTSFLTYYTYAREKYHQTAHGDMFSTLSGDLAGEIRGELDKSIYLMPNFAPAHELLGFFEMVQGDDITSAEQQLNAAIQLEPENPSYLYTLAQAQLRARDPAAARRTIQPLLLPTADAKLHSAALEMIQQINSSP
ncbi:MAG TPA: tetratricopeptide repeat protein [Verrucomicrobiae bacterium]|jgi:tetratricopeptide (TPR) repeat protein|nr:tetratricopeptide repeat protein [Verrucomicrobiae bacterium]